jgi:hypothetical protein
MLIKVCHSVCQQRLWLLLHHGMIDGQLPSGFQFMLQEICRMAAEQFATNETHGFFQDGFKTPVVNARVSYMTCLQQTPFSTVFESAALFWLY